MPRKQTALTPGEGEKHVVEAVGERMASCCCATSPTMSPTCSRYGLLLQRVERRADPRSYRGDNEPA